MYNVWTVEKVIDNLKKIIFKTSVYNVDLWTYSRQIANDSNSLKGVLHGICRLFVLLYSIHVL